MLLSPVGRQAITPITGELSPIGRTIQLNSNRNRNIFRRENLLKILPIKCHPFCSDLNELIDVDGSNYTINLFHLYFWSLSYHQQHVVEYLSSREVYISFNYVKMCYFFFLQNCKITFNDQLTHTSDTARSEKARLGIYLDDDVLLFMILFSDMKWRSHGLIT